MTINSADRLCDQLDDLYVPPFDFAAVERRVHSTREKQRPRRSIVAIGLLSIVLPALAVAAAHFAPIGITHRFGSWQLYSQTLEINRRPTQASLERLGLRAPYHVIWPQAFPTGMKIRWIASVASEVMIVQYRCPHSGETSVVIIPKDSDAINPKLQHWFSSQMMKTTKAAYEWTAGDERIRLQTNCLSAAQVARIQAAMINLAR